jgi:ribosomal protein S18 acetylase RimI-like enzyme
VHRSDVELALVAVDDPDRAAVLRVPAVAFSTPDASVPETPTDVLDFHADRLRSGLSLTAVARMAGVGPVCVGGLQIEGDGAEIVGLGTLPAWTRRGLGSAVCAFLAAVAFERGASFVYLSATDARVASLYSKVGFREIGVFCSATVPD